MDLSPPVSIVAVVLPALACLGIGAWAGAALSLRRARSLSRELACRELALLDARGAVARAERAAALDDRRGAALRLALRRLGLAERRVRLTGEALEAQQRRHFRELAALRLQAEESRGVARSAARLARLATAHLKRLEAAAPAVQTIVAREPKSYGAGDVHTVRVVDQARPSTRHDAVSRVSNRDSARLARLAPSNETRRGDADADDLKVVEGVSPAVEHRLREAGIRRVDQLAGLSDDQADALDRKLRRRNGLPLRDRWQGGARKALGRRPTA